MDAPAFNAGRDSPNAGLTVVALAPIDRQFSPRLATHLARLNSAGVTIPSQRKAAEVATDSAEEGVEVSRSILDQLEEPI